MWLAPVAACIFVEKLIGAPISREMVNVLRELSGLNLISADVVEVSPAYDHAEVTSLAAATIVYELTNLLQKKNYRLDFSNVR